MVQHHPFSLQYNCVSCYAFAALGALEGAIALSSGTLIDLSAQSIVDCSRELLRTFFEKC